MALWSGAAFVVSDKFSATRFWTEVRAISCSLPRCLLCSAQPYSPCVLPQALWCLSSTMQVRQSRATIVMYIGELCRCTLLVSGPGMPCLADDRLSPSRFCRLSC